MENKIGCKYYFRYSSKMHNLIRCVSIVILMVINTTLLAQEEEYGTGLIFDTIGTRSLPQHAILTSDSYRGLPSSVSLEQYCPTAGSQGKFGTCVGFASAYALRTILFVKAMREAGYSADPNLHQFSPTFVYEQIKFRDDIDCSKGSYISDALNLLQDKGVATLKTMPYQCGTSISQELLKEGSNFKILSYLTLFNSANISADQKVLVTKKALSEGNPCILGFKTTKSFKVRTMDIWRQQTTDDEPEAVRLGHAMCIVGYDDNKYGGSFRVLNSWGTTWGDKGFIWIPYKEFAKYSYQCYQANGQKIPPKKIDDPIKITKPDIKGVISFQQNTGEAMNVSLQQRSDDLVVYKMNKEYTSGTRFRFYMNTATDAYVYAFASDLSGKINQIFPYAENVSPFLGKNSTVAFPSETKVIRMDDNKGTDYLLILYSKKPLAVNLLLDQMKLRTGGLLNKAKASLQGALINPVLIKYASDRIAFELKTYTDADIVPVLIEIPHH